MTLGPPCIGHPVPTAMQGQMVSLPVLLAGHTPDMGRLPDLVLALGREVDWEEEVACFRGLATVGAALHCSVQAIR